MKLNFNKLINISKIKDNIYLKITQHKIIVVLIIIIVFMSLIYHNPIIVIEALAEEDYNQKNLNIEEIMKEIHELKEKHEELKKQHELTLKEMISYRKQLAVLYDLLNSFCYAVFIPGIVAIAVLIFRRRS